MARHGVERGLAQSLMNEKPIGPNAKKLLAHFIAREAVPVGGGLADGLNFLTDPFRRQRGMERAIANLDAALAAVKSAPDNPYGNDDEAIAAAILERVESAKETNKP